MPLHKIINTLQKSLRFLPHIALLAANTFFKTTLLTVPFEKSAKMRNPKQKFFLIPT